MGADGPPSNGRGPIQSSIHTTLQYIIYCNILLYYFMDKNILFSRNLLSPRRGLIGTIYIIIHSINIQIYQYFNITFIVNYKIEV